MASLIESSAKSLCRSCKTSRLHTKLFSSSATAMVGPESPNYIDIPRIIQPYPPQKRKVKGVLPVPREIFPRRRPDKPTKSYIDAATPEPSSNEPKVEKDHPFFEKLEWKRRMAEVRRQNLREGLVELYQRKQKEEAQMLARSRARQAQQKVVLNQPPREDERLTTASVPSGISLAKTPFLSDPNAKNRHERSVANHLVRQEWKSEERMDAIHTLYMNARDFITTEQQLDAEIERVFPTENNPDWANDQRDGDNVWNLGPPPTVGSLMHRKNDEHSKFNLIQDRTRKIAEALTGGKI
ncbi:conserved hypothetical protein [Uncinocarpus reesii 1704]|uniref:Uncharacterized protein n=1 Tax=Uncinocarpus reesii (strain UAMH 1704) TaxID=336963 RepID=C4JGA9_UNCRE|nr:uncharacterized protein UREG_02507 [Uncinocarpus reesii 1704]EEP77658.1 conserved hypothetical protein [Uncinocarpus reesii 1704]